MNIWQLIEKGLWRAFVKSHYTKQSWEYVPIINGNEISPRKFSLFNNILQNSNYVFWNLEI